MSSVSLDDVMSLLNFPDVALSGSCRRVSESIFPERGQVGKVNLICCKLLPFSSSAISSLFF